MTLLPSSRNSVNLLILSDKRDQGSRLFVPNNPVPELAQMSHVVLAFFLEEKSFDAFVVPAEVPFIRVAMLEHTAALEVMLAHRAIDGRNRVGRHREWLPQAMPRKTESVLIAVNVLIKEIRVFVEPHGEIERAPAACLVDDHLATFEFRFIAIGNAEKSPGGTIRLHSPVVRPEDRAGVAIFRRVEKQLRIDH